jgi:hypothetical protein
MIRTAEAIEFISLAESGRNAPLLITCEMADGTLAEVYLKPSGRPELGVEGMANELYAACVAGHLGLPVCEPILVVLLPDWIETIPDAALQDVLRRSCPISFGSMSAGDGWRIWASGDKVTGDRRDVATAICAFDAFTGNDDRRIQKPNLLVRGNDFRIIDHELCFRVRLKLFPRLEPWVPGNLSGLDNPERNILASALKGDHRVNVNSVRPLWANLTDDILEDFLALIPLEWAEAMGAIEDARNLLGSVRDKIDDCLLELDRVLK